MKNIFIVVLSLVILGCQPEKKPIPVSENEPSATTLHYASGFKVTYQDNNTKLVEVIYPFQGATSGYKYLLVPKGQTVPEHEADVRVISIPLVFYRLYVNNSYSSFGLSGETEKLVGFPSTDYISSEKARKLVDAGKVQELGVDKGLNLERIAMLQPGYGYGLHDEQRLWAV